MSDCSQLLVRALQMLTSLERKSWLSPQYYSSTTTCCAAPQANQKISSDGAEIESPNTGQRPLCCYILAYSTNRIILGQDEGARGRA